MLRTILSIFVGIVAVFSVNLFLNSSPADPSLFPRSITIEKGSVRSIARTLKTEGLIRSETYFVFLARISRASQQLKSGTYQLDAGQSSWNLLSRIKKADYQTQAVRITFPEGFNVHEMGEALEKAGLPFSKADFVRVAKNHEGFLFPDTYEFTNFQTAEEVIAEMEAHFVKKIEPLMSKIDSSKHSLSDIVKMAAIVEEEAANFEDRKKVAGILWKRIEASMPLQVCSSFVYVNGKSTWNLTTEDLAIDSPYNTYKYRGLTPTAITNPGLESIEATVNPVATPYWYFIADEKGKMYFARTYAEHQKNIDRYLK